MSENIIISASEVWGYFTRNKEALKVAMHKIAENSDYGVEIYVTTEYTGESPSIVVEADGMQIYEETIHDLLDCYTVVKNIYNNYLTEKIIEVVSDADEILSQDELKEEEEDAIANREDELDYALSLFLDVVLDKYTDIDSEEFIKIKEDVKDHFLEYLFRKHDCSIRRPMYIEYEDGEEVFEEYPYECMEFEDEDNPIYKK